MSNAENPQIADQMQVNLFNNSAHKNQLNKITCRTPFNEFHIYMEGKVSNCCFSWLPTHVGNINEQTLLEIINNETSRKIRNSVLNGGFKYCNTDNCPYLNEYLQTGKISHQSRLVDRDSFVDNSKELLLFLDYDQSCNLYCESCRSDRILFNYETAPEHLKKTHENVVKQIYELAQSNYNLTVQMCGSGDVFASSLYWKFLKELPPNFPLLLQIITNGILLTEDRLNYPYIEYLNHISISIDAATETTYETVRRGGKFNVIKKNLEMLGQAIQAKKFKKLENVEIIFVVQQENFHEMPLFVDWITQFKSFNRIWFNLIADWGHLTPERFAQKAIWKTEHPQHQEFLKVLTHPNLKNPRVYLGNLSKFIS